MSIVSGHPSSHEDAVYDEGLFRPDDDQLDLFALSRESNPRAERFARSGDPTEAAGGAAGHAMAAATSAGNQKAKPSGAIEDDMRRLAESVRWLQSETSACRLPRAAQLPAVDGLPALGADRYFDDPVDPYEWKETRLDKRPAAEIVVPEPVVRAPVRRRALARHTTVLLLACGGVVGFWLVNEHVGTDQAPSIRVSAAPPQGDVAEQLGLRSGQPADASLSIAALNPPVAADTLSSPAGAIDASVDHAAEAAPQGPRTKAMLASSSDAPKGEAVAVVADKAPAGAEPEGVAQQDAPAVEPSPTMQKEPPKAVLRPAEIASLLQRGKTYFEAGDVAAARLLFRRAVEAGDAAAAVAMGSTYDPAVLAAHFVHGVEANAETARGWYGKARDLGSPEGPRRIEMLARGEN
jgi:hypothetical protein